MDFDCFGYEPLRNRSGEFSYENLFINTLNVLGYIPGVSIISGLARVIFAKIMQAGLDQNDPKHKFYEKQITRGFVFEIMTGYGLGNLTSLLFDIEESVLASLNGRVKMKTA